MLLIDSLLEQLLPKRKTIIVFIVHLLKISSILLHTMKNGCHNLHIKQ